MRGQTVLVSLSWCVAASSVVGQSAGNLSRARGEKVYELDCKLAAEFDRKNPGVLPEKKLKLPGPEATAFDWSRHFRGLPIHAQRTSASCWGHAAVAALEWNWMIRNSPTSPVELAVQPIIDRIGKTGGLSIAIPLAILLQHGTCAAGQYKYTGQPGPVQERVKAPYRIVGWGRVAKNNKPTVQELKQALVEHGPLTASVFASPAFKSYKGGIFAEHISAPANDPTTHVVLIVGWDDRKGRGAWKVQNSTGQKWGDRGYGWIEYGCNNIGMFAAWIRAQSMYYRLPADAHELAGDDAESFPIWPKSKEGSDDEAATHAVAADKKGDEVLTPAEAAKRDGAKVTVRFAVKGTANYQGGVDLYSETWWKNPECFIVRLAKASLPRFQEIANGDLRSYYKGKTIRVRGALRWQETPEGKRAVLDVTEPEQISID